MLPRAMIEDFWNRVSQIVKKRCHLHEELAYSAVMRFRNEVEPKTGEMIYHENVEAVAETVVSAVMNGEYSDLERKGA